MSSYNPFNVSPDDAYRFVTEYEALRALHRNEIHKLTYRHLSSLPSDKTTLRRAIQYVYRVQSPMSPDEAEAFLEAYQYTAFFIDDRVAEAANNYSPEVELRQLRNGGRPGIRVDSLDLAQVYFAVTVEAENLKGEWLLFVKATEQYHDKSRANTGREPEAYSQTPLGDSGTPVSPAQSDHRSDTGPQNSLTPEEFQWIADHVLSQSPNRWRIDIDYDELLLSCYDAERSRTDKAPVGAPVEMLPVNSPQNVF